MISHDRAQLLLAQRLDGPLSLGEARELQNHLVACLDCRQFADEMERLAAGIRMLPHLPPSPVVTRGVLDAIAGGTSGWAWVRRGFGFAGSPAVAIASSMALIAALAGTIYLATNPDQDAPNPEATNGAVALAPEMTPTTTSQPTETPTPAPTNPPRSIAPNPTQRPSTTPTPRPPTSRTPTPRPTVSRSTAPPTPTQTAAIWLTAIPSAEPTRELVPAGVQPTTEPVVPPTEAPQVARVDTERASENVASAAEAAPASESKPAVRRAGEDRRGEDEKGAAKIAQEAPVEAARESSTEGADADGAGRADEAPSGKDGSGKRPAAREAPADDPEAADRPVAAAAAEPGLDEVPVEEAALAVATETPGTPDAVETPPEEGGGVVEPTIAPVPTTEPAPAAPLEPTATAEPVPIEPGFGPQLPDISLPQPPEIQQPISPPIQPVDGGGPATDDGGGQRGDDGRRQRRPDESSDQQQEAPPLEPAAGTESLPVDPVWVDPGIAATDPNADEIVDSVPEVDPALGTDPSLAPVDETVWETESEIEVVTPTP